MIDPSFLRKQKKGRWRFPVSSVLFHVLVVGGMILLEVYLRRQMAIDELKNEIQNRLDVRTISPEEFKQMFPETFVVETETTKDSGDQKKSTIHRSERRQRVKEETRAGKFGSVKGGKKKPSATRGAPGKRKDPFGRPVEETERSRLEKGTHDFLDPNIRVSTKTLLNTDEYLYSNFYNRMKEAIAQHWEPAVRREIDRREGLRTGLYKTDTKIFLSREGKVLEVGLLRSSGLERLDAIAMNSIRAGERFNNPPAELFKRDPRAGVLFTFVVQIHPQAAPKLHFVPDERLLRRR